ncbi:MAG: hypothetical protein ACOX21_00475 [Bacillota bacterium]
MKQPAVKSYFFGKGYRDAFRTIGRAWRYNMEDVSKHRDNIAYYVGGWFGKIWVVLFNVFAILSVIFIGTAVFLAVTVIHLTLVFTLMLAVYALFSLVWIADKLFLLYHRVFVACPKCRERFSKLIYFCPKCGIKHTNLAPGVYGILYRTCSGESGKEFCGRRLPATFFTGRGRLQSQCPVCEAKLAANEAVPVCIPVVGGTSVGKTCFITAVMKVLIEEIAPQNKLTIYFNEKKSPLYMKSKVDCEEMIRKFNSGIKQNKTSDFNPLAYNFFIKSKNLVPERLMYIYDIAGEALFTEHGLTTQKQYDYSHGIIFLVDPLAIPKVRRQYQHCSDFSKHSATESDLNDAFESFLHNFQRISGLSTKRLSSIPCAIVINKTDAYDLENKIGFKAAAAAYFNPPKGKKFKKFEDAMSHVARKWLLENEMSNFVKQVEMSFKHKKYFTCSSLGHVNYGKAFTPIRVFLPVKWIVGHFDKALYRRLKPYAVINHEGQVESA